MPTPRALSSSSISTICATCFRSRSRRDTARRERRKRLTVPNNIDMTVGNLGLTDQEENQIVTFMQTLTDGFTTPYPDINTFTGQCKTGGTAATQGNALLIPTPDQSSGTDMHEGRARSSCCRLSNDDLAIIRWTSSNPEGDDEHFGVVGSEGPDTDSEISQ
jgi:hypothetical protein